MKISSSSSLLFATLAISSSSSSLAAPAGDNGHSEGVSDVQQSARRASMADRSVVRSILDSRQLQPIGTLLDELPLLGTLLEPIINTIIPPSDPHAAKRDQLDAINGVTQLPGNITQSLPTSSLTVPSPSIPFPIPGKRSEDDEVADSSSVSTSCTSSATDDAPASATQGSMAAAGIPANPVPVALPSSSLPVSSLPTPFAGLPIPAPLPTPSAGLPVSPPLLLEEAL